MVLEHFPCYLHYLFCVHFIIFTCICHHIFFINSPLKHQKTLYNHGLLVSMTSDLIFVRTLGGVALYVCKYRIMRVQIFALPENHCCHLL